MKTIISAVSVLFMGQALAGDVTPQSSPAPSGDTVHRYLIERTFPAGALDGLDAAVKQKVNANNASVGVQWEQSYANESKTKTFCVYDAPSEAAVRKAATLNGLPVDSITEVPVDVDSGAHMPASMPAADKHRFIVERTLSAGEVKSLNAAGKAKVNAANARFGVYWVKSYANADKTKTYGIYEGPSLAAVRSAASANGVAVDSVMEIPVTLLPK
jgi:hypothetical protein